MYAPTDAWRCKEDLKVILIAKNGKFSKEVALSFFQKFGKLTSCLLYNHEEIACGVFTTEEQAEEALKIRKVVINGLNCDVTTFKSGNRKNGQMTLQIFISPLTLSERALREYFEPIYGPILRFEPLPNNGSCFILFLKVDSAVACRNMHHIINGCNVFARPGCTPGTAFMPDRSSMYRLEPRNNLRRLNGLPVQQRQDDVASPSNLSGESPILSPLQLYSSDSFLTPRSSSDTIVSPSPSDASSDASSTHSDQLYTSPFPETASIFSSLLTEMGDLVISEKVEKKKKKISEVEREESVLTWQNLPTHEQKPSVPRGIVDTDESRVKRRDPLITVMFPSLKEGNKELNKCVTPPPPPTVSFPVDDKVMRLEKKRIELNLPPFDDCAHYARDEEGFPIHHNGRYINSILKDGRFRFKDANHISFNMEKNTVQIFEPTEMEYAFLETIISPVVGRFFHHDENDDDGWGNAKEVKMATPTGESSRHFKWPVVFPSMPLHFPLMDNCTCPDEMSLHFDGVMKYLNHLEIRWKLTRQENFLSAFAAFFRDQCSVCNTKLEGPRRQFEHIFSKPHLRNLNRYNVKYSPSDFTFWHNLLFRNYDTGKKRK